MITSPSTVLAGADSFDTVYRMSHQMKYRFFINGTEYRERDLNGIPKVERILFETPEIGTVTTGTLDITIYPKETIPKAARISCEIQLTGVTGAYTSWYPVGTFFVSKRQMVGSLMNLQCRDSMVKAGRKYEPLTQIEEWPASCSDVAEEIADLMGVTVDPRSPLNNTYTVDHPNDLLMSEVLAMIGAMHGGTWVITAENKLRLIAYPDPEEAIAVQDIGKKYTSLHEFSTGNSYVSRVTLADDAGNEFSYGTDDGLELGAKCFYCTDAITLALYDSIYGAGYRPYEIDTAYISPLVELGDALQLTKRSGDLLKIIVGYMCLRLSVTSRATLRCGVDDDDEEEVPYMSEADLRASRTVSQLGTYYGNRINRSEGFVSEFLKDGEVVAKMTANANEFSMKQKTAGGQWQNRIYFDAVNGKYVIDGDVTVQSVANLENGLRNTASYIFDANGFNGKLVSDPSFMATDGNATSAKSTAEYIASAEGFNATLQSNSDYGTQKAQIQANAGEISLKVSKSNIINEINASTEGIQISGLKVDINGAEISLTGRVSANNNVVIGQDGKLTAVNMVANGGNFNSVNVTGKLVGGNWTFDTNGGQYSDSAGRKVVMTILSGGRQADGWELADDPSEYRAYYHGSNCDIVYGGDMSYSQNVFMRGKRLILMAGTDNNQKAIMGLFKSGEGSGTEFSFFPYEDACGNIGSSVRRWDYVRGAHPFSTSSSRKRKENIEDIEGQGEIIDALQPVTFDYIADHSHSAGFILEDVYEVMPMFCDVEGGDFEHGGIFYEQFIPYIVKELQSLRMRMRRLEGIS